jgi:predicted TIM-barrel fold metal-dependent hydrolase
MSVDAGSEDDRLVVVSTDTHCGPSLEHDLRQYCPAALHDDFAHYVAAIEALRSGGPAQPTKTGEHEQRARVGVKSHVTPLALEALARTKACRGQADPDGRHADMDADGVAADVLFAGGQNGEVLAFQEFGLAGLDRPRAGALMAAGNRIWNRWLAEFVAVAPHRHVGVMEVPMFDVDLAIAEVEWGRANGLKAVNLPAPKSHLPAYNEELYDRFFAVCADLDLPLVTHVGGGDPPLGATGAGGYAVSMYETQWLSRRAVWQLIFGGVFERHPTLRFVIAECRVAWVAEALADMDSYCRSDLVPALDHLSRLPSEYWATNCFNAGSFLAPFEAARRHEVGVANLMWGSDYPHAEGTWPRTRLAMHNTFAGLPEHDVRAILGENAVRVFSLDGAKLTAIADQIGPTLAEISDPLPSEALPELRGYAFRDLGAFA